METPRMHVVSYRESLLRLGLQAILGAALLLMGLTLFVGVALVDLVLSGSLLAKAMGTRPIPLTAGLGLLLAAGLCFLLGTPGWEYLRHIYERQETVQLWRGSAAEPFLRQEAVLLRAASAPATPEPVLVLREGWDGAINEWSGPARFVLYNDGTVITETSNETSENGGELRYYRTHLSPAQASRLIRSLGVKKTIGTSRRQYGQGVGPDAEGVTWQLIYWGASSQGKITIIGSLNQAPARVVKLVRSLENYPGRGTRYLDYDYLLSFSNSPVQPAMPWPKEWRFLKFSEAMLSGQRVPDGVYQYRIEAPHALALIEKLARAGTQCVSVNSYVWKVDLSPAPRLPNDLLWVQHPL